MADVPLLGCDRVSEGDSGDGDVGESANDDDEFGDDCNARFEAFVPHSCCSMHGSPKP